MNEIKLGIVMATYKQKKNNTFASLSHAVKSIRNQTYKNYKLFLIGDRYEDDKEFDTVTQILDKDKIFSENLSYAAERDKYGHCDTTWLYGGVNALNYGIDKAVEEGIEYICHLDHDDYWSLNHLDEIYNAIKLFKPAWVCTRAFYCNRAYVPLHNREDLYIKFLPQFENVVHSSVCMSFKQLNVRYKNNFEIHGRNTLPGDGQMWTDSAEIIKTNNLYSVHINKVTTFKSTEKSEFN